MSLSSADSARLTGVVRDTAGAPVSDAEVVLADANISLHAGADGRFTLTVAPGTHDVWFRKIGYQSVRYTWVAGVRTKTDLAILLRALPHTLDPVVVRAREDRVMHGTGTLRGVVVDSSGAPIPDAEVQIVGAHADGVTRANGGFLFESLPAGSLLLRIRKLGYSPVVTSLQLVPSDDREITVRLHSLPVTLDPIVVNERSGYGGSQSAWDEFERRRRFWTADAIVLGPEDLRQYHSLPLDLASKLMLHGAEESQRLHAGQVLSIVGNKSIATGEAPETEADACILENGTRARYQPLRLYDADDIQLLEIYPSGSELSGTVAARMDPLRECRALGLVHRTYYVIWLKDAR